MAKPSQKDISLTFSHVVRIERKRCPLDRRRIVEATLVSYRGDDGHEYRREFYALPGITYRPPERTTVSESRQFGSVIHERAAP